MDVGYSMELRHAYFTTKIYKYLVAIPGLSGRIFKKPAKRKEILLFQLVGAQALSIADSSF
jgi:hypothetical protein